MLLLHDEWRSQQNMVPPSAVDGATHRVDHQSARHRLALDPRVQLLLWGERLFGGAVVDEFEAAKQSAASDVSDMMVVGETLMQPAVEIAAHRDHLGQQAVAPDDLLYREAGGRGHGVAHISVAVLEETGSLRERLEDGFAKQDSANRLVAAAETLGDRHQI